MNGPSGREARAPSHPWQAAGGAPPLPPLAVALDLDGTLLCEGTLSEANREAVSVLVEHGAAVILATGKHPLALWPYAEQAALTAGPHIALSGACITAQGGRETTLVARLTPTDAVAVVEVVRDLDLAFAVFSLDAIRIDATAGGRANSLELQQRLEAVGEPTILDPDPLRFPSPIGKILVLLERTDPRESVLAKRAPIAAHPLRSGPFFVDLGPSGSTKGTALRTVCTGLGIPLQRVWAMGDSENDIALLASAGLGVTFEGAPLALLAHADHVLPAGPDAVREALEALLPDWFPGSPTP